MSATHKKVVSFSEYKEMSDEIKSFFKPEFERIHDRIKTLDQKIDQNFNTLDKKIDQRFDLLNKKIDQSFKIGSAILIAVIISIIANIFK